MTTPTYYGCTGAHPELTCLKAYYHHGQKFKKPSSWCAHCRTHYPHPDKEMSDASESARP